MPLFDVLLLLMALFEEDPSPCWLREFNGIVGLILCLPTESDGPEIAGIDTGWPADVGSRKISPTVCSQQLFKKVGTLQGPSRFHEFQPQILP